MTASLPLWLFLIVVALASSVGAALGSIIDDAVGNAIDRRRDRRALEQWNRKRGVVSAGRRRS